MQALSSAWPRAQCQSALMEWPLKALLRPAQLVIAAPCFLFLAALAAMLLRHPDVEFYQIDRIAFAFLLIAVIGRAVVVREKVFVFERATWPMIGLMLLTVPSVLGQPFNNETWSLLASKFIVPFAMFHLAALVFTDEKRLRAFELFCLAVLGYLAFTATAFLFGMNWLILPRFILDSSLGAHADRARGPLLQAVANGVSLNVLGLLAVHSYQRGRTRSPRIVALLASVPIAILATMTRAVWLSFAGTLAALMFISERGRSRRMYLAISVVAVIGLGLALNSDRLQGAVTDRLSENKAIEFRQAVYAGAWQMFLERPLTGWGFHQMPEELHHYVVGYEDKILYPHNTYLELLAEQGIVGFGFYAWLMWEFWRLRRAAAPNGDRKGFLDENFHRLWPIMLLVYWINGAVVVMSYQFVNALLFTIAGMLAAQHRRQGMTSPC